MTDLLRLWFGFDRPVLRRDYVVAGVGLILLKYLVDTTAVRLGTEAWLTPWQFLSPLFGTRRAATDAGGLDLQWFLILWALPFAWVGVSMSLRRAASAGVTPWWGMLFFVPGLNYLLMLALALAPDRSPEAWAQAAVEIESRREDADVRVRIAAAARGLAVGLALTLAMMVVVGLLVTPAYGYSLFLGAPVTVGATSGFAYNRSRTMGVRESIAVGLVAVTLALGLALIFGLEGALCLAMAAPIAFGGAVIGVLLGRSIALAGYRSAAALFVVAATVPLLGWAENRLSESDEGPTFEARTTILVEAYPEEVWEAVIGFPPLPEPESLLFRLGIAYPIGAEIEGVGVGAVRRCEFSTGPFIEPVTAWDPGRLLAFDVAENPEGMREWSPYGELVTAHLESGFRAVRGEFRLTPVGEGKTLLSGTTWYQLELAPRLYWKLWADWIVHRIHRRVLRHVEGLASAATARSHAGSRSFLQDEGTGQLVGGPTP